MKNLKNVKKDGMVVHLEGSDSSRIKFLIKNAKEFRDCVNVEKLTPMINFKLFYDSYLKANNQVHGIQSYNRMVGLLVNYRMLYDLN